jgi:hypothetical protein
MRKVVIHTGLGGFALSNRGMARYCELKGQPLFFYAQDSIPGSALYGIPFRFIPKEEAVKVRNPYRSRFLWSSVDLGLTIDHISGHYWLLEGHIERDDPCLVQAVEELGSGAQGFYANLKIVEIPDDVRWQVEKYEAGEYVAEVHRRWE